MKNPPGLVIGLGCQRGCSASALRGLLDQTLRAHGLALDEVRGLASIDLKRDEPGLLALAAQLRLPLTCFSSAQLLVYQDRLTHRSAIAFEHTGCHGVAESAALALAEQLGITRATLLIARQKSPQATLALARVS